jgi:hypothetical protein
MRDFRVLCAYVSNINDNNNGWIDIKVELFQYRVAVTAMCHCNIICIYSKGVDTDWIICILKDSRSVLDTAIYSLTIVLLQTSH